MSEIKSKWLQKNEATTHGNNDLNHDIRRG